jgi:signal transduction histidine kinase
LLLGAIGFAFGLLSLAVARSAPGGSFGGTSSVAALAEVAAGWSLITVGLVESQRRPTIHPGLLLAGAGIGWFFVEWNNPGLGSSVAFTFGLIGSALAPPLVAHAALAYPTGRLDSRLDRAAIAATYAGAGLVLGLVPAVFFDPARQGCGLCPVNLVLVRSEPGVVSGLQRAGLFVGLGWMLALLTTGVRRLRMASPPLRRMLWPVLVPAGGYLILVGLDFAHSVPRGTLSNDPLEYRLWLGEAGLLVLIALGVASTWVRNRRTRSAVARLVVEAAQSSPTGGLRGVLSEMLGDRDLELAYPVGQAPRLVSADGRAVSVDPADVRAITPLVSGGRTVAILVHRPGLLDDPGTVEEVQAAARLVLENERLHAEVRSQLEDLRASRARIVETGDAERRRLERDLHDGAQQRLVGLSLALRLARARLDSAAAPRVEGLLNQAEGELRRTIDELRELAHGIYPAVLTDEGLAAAVEALAERSAVPIAVGAIPEERFPLSVEAAAYFLIADAAGFAVAQAETKGAKVQARNENDRLLVEVINDDRVALPNEELDAKFLDLADRVGALGGRVRVELAPGGAIAIRAEIPCGW